MHHLRNNPRVKGKVLLLTGHYPTLVVADSNPVPLWNLPYTQKSTYVNVRMKWKKDSFYDTLDVVNKSKDLRTILSLKNIIARAPDGCIPVSAVSKKARILEIHGRVAAFLRKYPSFFEEFVGPQHGHPWFRLTREAVAIDMGERRVFEERRVEFLDRLRRVVLMTREGRLPLQIVQGLQWCLGLPEDFTRKLEEEEEESAGCGWFWLVEMGDGIRGLCVVDDGAFPYPPMSVIQKNVLKSVKLGRITAECSTPLCIPFPLYPSKGVRLKRKIANWLEEFQKLPYMSPYEHHGYRDTDPCSDLSEKRVVGVLHELLCLMVDHSAERRRLLCLQKHLGLPQKFGRVFERHPHIFYLHMKNKTCNVVLKEAYHGGEASAIETHPLLGIREKYIRLMTASDFVLRKRRSKDPKHKIEAQC